MCVSGGEGPQWLRPWGWGVWRAESAGGLAHLSSFSLKRSGTSEAVQPSQLRKQSLVGSTLDGWTTRVDIRPWLACWSGTGCGSAEGYPSLDE